MGLRNKFRLFVCAFVAASTVSVLGWILVFAAKIYVLAVLGVTAGAAACVSGGILLRLRRYRRIVGFVHENGSCDITELAKELSVGKNKAREWTEWCLRLDYLKGYVFRDERIYPLENYRLKGKEEERADKQARQTMLVRCAHCGAEFAAQDEIAVCPYCGSLAKGGR